jgi:hypothetical protein
VHGIDEKPFAAVLGVAELHVYRDEAVLVGGDGDTTHTIRCGDIISIHGQTGEVYFGARRILSTATDGIAEGAAAKQAEKSF